MASPVTGFLGLVVALALAGCSRKSSSTAHPIAGALWQVEMTSKLTFLPDTFSCAPGQRVVVRVTNTIPAHTTEIAHTFVLLQSGVDPDDFGSEAGTALPENDYVPAKYRDRILARTRLVHPGETVEVEFTAPPQPGIYPIACTFPGHCILGMRGQLAVR